MCMVRPHELNVDFLLNITTELSGAAPDSVVVRGSPCSLFLSLIFDEGSVLQGLDGLTELLDACFLHVDPRYAHLIRPSHDSH